MKTYQTMFGEAIAKIEEGKTVVYLKDAENKVRAFQFDRHVKPALAVDHVTNGILNRSIPKDYETFDFIKRGGQ